MNELGDRLAALIDAAGISQSELARRVGVSQPAINHLMKRGGGGSAHLHKIARELGTTPEYLTGETDDPSASSMADSRNQFRHAPADLADLDLVELKEIDLKFGMGATELEVPVTVQVRHFSRAWLRQYTHAAPENLHFAQGIGDSMMPTLHDSDLLLIDRSETNIRMAEKIWAVAYGNSGMVKRLRAMADGSVKLMSDNPLVPDEVAHDGELHILGRVVAVVRKM